MRNSKRSDQVAEQIDTRPVDDVDILRISTCQLAPDIQRCESPANCIWLSPHNSWLATSKLRFASCEWREWRQQVAFAPNFLLACKSVRICDFQRMNAEKITWRPVQIWISVYFRASSQTGNCSPEVGPSCWRRLVWSLITWQLHKSSIGHLDGWRDGRVDNALESKLVSELSTRESTFQGSLERDRGSNFLSLACSSYTVQKLK